MAVKIRMKSLGRKHRPFFRICVMHGSDARDGKAIEELGTYDPMVKVKADRVKLNLERVDYWISVGAQPSERVATLVKKLRANSFGSASAPPALTPPKPLEVAEAPAEAAAESAEPAEATE